MRRDALASLRSQEEDRDIVKELAIKGRRGPETAPNRKGAGVQAEIGEGDETSVTADDERVTDETRGFLVPALG